MTRLLLGIFVALTGMSAPGPAIAGEWPTAMLGPKQVWETATDQITQTRFVPMQLIVPGAWDGTHRIDLPIATKFDAEGTVWTGPEEWRNPYTRQLLTVYDRRRTNRREGPWNRRWPYARMARPSAESTIRGSAGWSVIKKQNFLSASGNRAKSARSSTCA